jgi:hypothetical protein
LLISVGQRERAPGSRSPRPAAEIPSRTTGDPRDARDLAARLSASGVDGLVVEFREFPEEDHGTVVLPAASRAVRFALDGE